jgi:hypothetical protein
VGRHGGCGGGLGERKEGLREGRKRKRRKEELVVYIPEFHQYIHTQ